MKRRNFILGSASLAGAATTGAIAFTSGTVERDVTINVANDSDGVVGLTPGDTEAATLNGDTLVIDTSTNNSNGLNVDADFEYGDSTDAEDNNLFTLTNNADSEREFTVDYDQTEGGDGAVTFVFDNGEDVSDGTDADFTLDSGESVYVTLSIDTDGLSDGDDIGGTLTVSANDV